MLKRSKVPTWGQKPALSCHFWIELVALMGGRALPRPGLRRATEVKHMVGVVPIRDKEGRPLVM